jgi:hypothetical protein
MLYLKQVLSNPVDTFQDRPEYLSKPLDMIGIRGTL